MRQKPNQFILPRDFLSLGYSVKERNRPEEMSAKPEKGKRFNVPVGGLDVHKVTLVVSIADSLKCRYITCARKNPRSYP